MFKAAASPRPQSAFNGILDEGSHIHGELRFDKEFRIQGELTGSIVSEGLLMILEEGKIEGDIRVRKVVVSGTIKGTLQATETIHITASGKVFADISTPSLTIEDGAFFEGRCSMGKPVGQPLKQPLSQASNQSVEPQRVTKMPVAQRG
jgi:cytoskeletal protein CcmA (bactofilin family)